MGLPLPLAGAAGLFLEQFAAFDATFTRVAGRWQKITSADRTIGGVIQTDRERDVFLESDGALSDGSILLHTRALIYVADMSQETGDSLMQTYVKYAGEEWKVNRYAANWTIKTQGYEKYFLTKYTNIDE